MQLSTDYFAANAWFPRKVSVQNFGPDAYVLLCLISNCRCFFTNNIGKYHAQRLLCLSPNFLRYYCCTKYLVTASLNVCHNSFKEMFLTRPPKFDFARCLGVLAFSVVLKYIRCTCYSRGTRQIYWNSAEEFLF